MTVLKRHWPKVAGLVVVVALVVTASQYAGALGRADENAAQVVRLQEDLSLKEADTERLTAELSALDDAKDTQARQDSVLIDSLTVRAQGLNAALARLASADSANVEAVDSLLTVLRARLRPEDLPALQSVTRAYSVRVDGLLGQINVQQESLAVKDDENAILAGQLASEREARSAADALVTGLRAEIVQHVQIEATQAMEIGNLRNAVAPGFFRRFVQEIEIVTAAATAAALLTLLLTN